MAQLPKRLQKDPPGGQVPPPKKDDAPPPGLKKEKPDGPPEFEAKFTDDSALKVVNQAKSLHQFLPFVARQQGADLGRIMGMVDQNLMQLQGLQSGFLGAKREAEASTAPGFPDADAGDPAHFVAVLVADQGGCDLVLVVDGEPEVGRGAGVVEPAAAPVLERLGLVPPLVGEGVLGGVMEGFGVLAVEGARLEAGGPAGLGRRFAQLDRHSVEVADGVVAVFF